MEPTYEVVWPKSPQGVQPGRLADRLADLDGKTIAFVWDYLFRGDELFPILERELTKRFDGLEVIGYDTFGNSHGGDEDTFIANLPTVLELHDVDAVISGMGC